MRRSLPSFEMLNPRNSVLKNNEIRRLGEYRARLVLAAWDAQEAQPAAAQ
jgi:hypothetical protein